MAQGDLFDVSMGGHGFHITAHLVALAALFIACFAIAGYVSFREDSISSKSLKNGVSLTLPGVERRAYSYTYPSVTVAANQSIGPFIGAAAIDGSSKLSLVSVEVSQSASQAADLGAIAVQRAGATGCAVGGAGSTGNDADDATPKDNHTMIFAATGANTADSEYRIDVFANSQAIGFSNTSEQLCLKVQNGATVTAGAITVKYVLEHGPGGSFPPLLTTGTHTIIA